MTRRPDARSTLGAQQLGERRPGHDGDGTLIDGPFPQATRRRHAVHALLTDAYFGGYVGYHLSGFNALFGDLHARRVPDPRGVIVKGVGGGSTYTHGDIATRGRAFMVWDYFSRRP